MPAWSTEIANEFIARAIADQHPLDQSVLQCLVYIAHGHCLALTGQPLTGDRPEAWSQGPIYRRLANALARWGNDPVHSVMAAGDLPGALVDRGPRDEATSDLDQNELAVVERVFESYAYRSRSALAVLVQGRNAPWFQVFDNGKGVNRDIHHQLIKAQFERFNDPEML